MLIYFDETYDIWYIKLDGEVEKEKAQVS